MYDPYRQKISSNPLEMGGLDVQLRQFMLKIYNYMAAGLAITGVVAFAVSQSPTLMKLLFGSGLSIVVALAPVGMAFYFASRIEKMTPASAQTFFWIFASLMGVSISYIFVVYQVTSIIEAFFITSSTFAGMSLYGYTTKRDLTSLGSFLFMGLFGIFIASIVNLFLGNNVMGLVISFLAVIIFTGLTAYETQQIKNTFTHHASQMSQDALGRLTIVYAFNLYLNFINLFMHLLRLLGDRR